MSIPRFSPSRSAAIRDALVAKVEAPRRPHRAWMNVAVFALSGALVGGAVSGAAWAAGSRGAEAPPAVAPTMVRDDGIEFIVGEGGRLTQVGHAENTGVPAPEGIVPGAPIVSLLDGGGMTIVDDRRVVPLDDAPAAATHVRVMVTCDGAGGLSWGQDPEGHNPRLSCSVGDGPENSLSSFDFDLADGRVLYLAATSGTFTVSWQYLDLVETAWGVTATGESYGVAKADGRTPDLIAVTGRAPDGSPVLGYSRWAELEGPMPANPEEAATWDPQPFDVPVYAPDGVTQIGVFTVG
jgi:hypothetical protein